MIEISELCKYIIVTCPKCNNGNYVRYWGKQKCRYQNCDNEWDVSYDPELLLKEAIIIKKQFDNLLNTRGNYKYVPPILQKISSGGYIGVHQPWKIEYTK